VQRTVKYSPELNVSLLKQPFILIIKNPQKKTMAHKIKVTQELKNIILSQFNEGLSKYRIARLNGVSETMVRYIIHPEKIAENRKNTVKNNVKNVARVKAFRERQKIKKSDTPMNTGLKII
jgi:predicted transcriptional regulator